MQTFETIRTRLQTQAAGRFSNINQETKLFIDWMANELNTLHRDLSRSNDAIERRLLQRLQPDVQTRPAPTHTLAYAQPRQNGYVLRPDEDVFTIPRMGQEAPQQIFFSPLLPVPLVKGKVKYLVNDQSLVEIVEYANRQIRTSKSTGAAAHPGVLCVGVQLNTPLLPEQRLCFFLDWKTDNTARKQELYRRLPLVSWYQNEQSLPTETGLWFERKSIERYTPNYVDEEFLHQYSLEQNTLQHYNHCFVTVQASEVQKTALPDELSKQFPPEILEAIGKEEVVWFKLLFPAGFTSEEIRQTTLQLNCFPILNRRLDRTRDFTPAGNSGVEIVALSNADKGRAALSDLGAYFLGIQRIFTRHTDYRPLTFDHFRNASAGYYTLQRGRVEANDFRDLYARISELSHLLRSHASTLMLLPQHTVNQALSNIEHGAETLQIALQQIPPKDLDLGYYLHLKVLDPQDMIYVRFWLTQGEYAQGICTQGDLLTAERGAVLEGDVGWVV